MNNTFKKIKSILSKKQGLTLVEEMVALVLLVIVCSMMYLLVCKGFLLYNRIRVIANARTVSTMLMDKITGEISGAQIGTNSKYTMTVSSDYGESSTYLSSTNGEYITFYTRTSSPVYITNVDGEFLMHYRPINNNNIRLPESDWTFDKKAYLGYEISDLKFEIVYKDGRKTNIIKTYLTIKHSSSGYEYKTEKNTECYNFTNQQDISKLNYGGIFTDDAFSAMDE